MQEIESEQEKSEKSIMLMPDTLLERILIADKVIYGDYDQVNDAEVWGKN